MNKKSSARNKKKNLICVLFGRIVRQRRIALALSQEKLAEAADLHTNYVGSVERGEKNIGLVNIFAIAKALKCDPKDLMPEY